MVKHSYVSLRKNLLLLALARGLMFWYAIEKFFYLEIGISVRQIVLAGVISQGSKVLFELPTSVFADRWSRKKTLLAADVALIVSSLILGFAHDFGTIVLGLVAWALSDALSSGVYEAFAYDSLAVQGWKRHFRKVHTRMVTIELLAIAAAGHVAGVLAKYSNLRLSFFVTIVPLLASMYLLIRMREPPIQRTTDLGVSWWRHIGGAAKLLSGRHIWWPVVLMVGMVGFTSVWYEYYQLVGVDVGLSGLFIGGLIGVLTLGMSVGSEIAHKKPGSKIVLLFGWSSIAAAHLLGLPFRNPLAAIASIFFVSVAFRMMEAYLEIYLHEHIPSDRRATIISLATTAGYAWFFVQAFIYAQAIKYFDARAALIITSLPMIALGIVDVLRGLPWSSDKTAAEIPDDSIGLLEEVHVRH